MQQGPFDLAQSRFFHSEITEQHSETLSFPSRIVLQSLKLQSLAVSKSLSLLKPGHFFVIMTKMLSLLTSSGPMTSFKV